jgi:hypothetical protein
VESKLEPEACKRKLLILCAIVPWLSILNRIAACGLFSFYLRLYCSHYVMHFTQQGAARRNNEHRICMNFMERHGWHIGFLEEDCRTSLPLKLTFEHPDKILEMYERWGANRLLEDRAAVEHGIEIGRGAVWLRLTPEQYAKLKRR